MDSLFNIAFPDPNMRNKNRDLASILTEIQEESIIHHPSISDFSDRLDLNLYNASIKEVDNVTLADLKEESLSFRLAQAYRSLGYQVSLRFSAIAEDGKISHPELAWQLIVKPQKNALSA